MAYWIQLEETKWIVATCWEESFDWINALLNDPSTAAGTGRAVRENWPTFRVLFERSVDPTHHELTLFRVSDPDANAERWMLGAFFGNVYIDSPADFFVGSSLAAFTKVCEVTFSLLGETKGGDPLSMPRLTEYIGAAAQKDSCKPCGRPLLASFKRFPTYTV